MVGLGGSVSFLRAFPTTEESNIYPRGLLAVLAAVV